MVNNQWGIIVGLSNNRTKEYDTFMREEVCILSYAHKKRCLGGFLSLPKVSEDRRFVNKVRKDSSNSKVQKSLLADPIKETSHTINSEGK